MRREATQAVSAVRGAVEPGAVAARAISALTDLLAAPVEVTVDTAGPDLATTLTTHTLSLRLAAPASDATSWWLVLELEVALVVAVVARVTKRPAPRVIHAGLATPAMLGAFAAVVGAAVRRAGVPVVVAPVGEGAATHIDEDGVTVAGFTVEAEGQATHVRAFFPTALLANRRPAFGRASLSELGELLLTLPLIACRTGATAAELAALAVGDAWMLDDAWKLGPWAGPRRGRAWLCAAMAEQGLCVDLEGDGQIVLREGVEELCWSPMHEEADEALVAAVGDVPIVVRVEIGAATMKARDWSALKPGDVIGLGGRIGGPVTLRASGLAVAEGELVDLDGEVGIRILRRLGGAAP